MLYFDMQSSTVMTRVFGIDTRGLSAFRIALGSLLLIDLGLRSRDLKAHYTDQGILPLDVYHELLGNSWRWSIHSLHGSVAFQVFLFVIAGVFAACYLTGYRSRWAAIASWLLLTSLQTRNPFVVNGGDVLIRMLLFWSIFLPLDRHWALTRKRATEASASIVTSLATAAILLQVGVLYLMAGYFKYRGMWDQPDILERILQSDAYAKPLAYQLSGHSELLHWAGSAALISELILPFLIFSPIWTRQIRLFAIAWFLLFHVGIELTLTVGLFSYASCSAWILFIPTSLWNRLTKIPFRETRPSFVDRRSRRWHYATSGIVALALAFTLWINFTTIREPWIKPLRNQWVNKVSDVTTLRQRWNLFAKPLPKDGWYVGVARLKDGETVDLFRDGAPADWESYTKPKYVSEQFANHRWRKYYRRILTPTRVNLRDPLSWYLIREWNAEHGPDEQIESFELHFMQEIGVDEEGVERYQQRFLSEIQVTEPATD